MGEMRIAVRHVLPNTLAPLIVLGTAQLGSAILVEASLSFLGLSLSWQYWLQGAFVIFAAVVPMVVRFRRSRAARK